MSNAAIRKALENRVKTLPGDLPISWENVNFEPANDGAFVSTFLLFAEPQDLGFKDSPYIQRGYLQLGFHYPTNAGPGAAQAQAEVARAHFARGLSLKADGITTVIDRTPEITGGAVEDSRFVIRARIRFYAHIDPTA